MTNFEEDHRDDHTFKRYESRRSQESNTGSDDGCRRYMAGRADVAHNTGFALAQQSIARLFRQNGIPDAI